MNMYMNDSLDKLELGKQKQENKFAHHWLRIIVVYRTFDAGCRH